MTAVDAIGRRLRKHKAMAPRRYGQVLPEEWKDQAKCKELPPSEIDRIFFPNQWGGKDRARRAAVVEARRICAECPVNRECGEYAFAAESITDGIWAGVSAFEWEQLRRAERRRR